MCVCNCIVVVVNINVLPATPLDRTAPPARYGIEMNFFSRQLSGRLIGDATKLCGELVLLWKLTSSMSTKANAAVKLWLHVQFLHIARISGKSTVLEKQPITELDVVT